MSPLILIDELERRWESLFTQLGEGLDVPPGPRLRIEGMMEAAVLLKEASEVELTQAMDACYLRVQGRALAVDFGADWQQFYPFPQIPAVARRAPVVPSTSD